MKWRGGRGKGEGYQERSGDREKGWWDEGRGGRKGGGA